jgi:hypothetical protein
MAADARTWLKFAAAAEASEAFAVADHLYRAAVAYINRDL